ncbi:tetratricopeptide repeat protein [Actinacidiphila sp. bgisy144]|uniref:tetratricopeptide repeat protein n=1 Tax=Actinacidiphila sp. bgisy144 TaxID=3413791 RepID=UPI003EBD2943
MPDQALDPWRSPAGNTGETGRPADPERTPDPDPEEGAAARGRELPGEDAEPAAEEAEAAGEAEESAGEPEAPEGPRPAAEGAEPGEARVQLPRPPARAPEPASGAAPDGSAEARAVRPRPGTYTATAAAPVPAPAAPPRPPHPPAAAPPQAPPATEPDSGAVVRPLPEPAPYFTGRERELAQLRADIVRPGLAAAGRKQPDRGRVLLVVGRPGAGRTEVAVKLAREVAAAYPDGRFFTRLTGTDGEPVPAERVARALLGALAARVPSAARPAVPGQPSPGSGGAEPAEDPVAALRKATAGRRLLLVLDDVARADQLTALLPDAPGSLVVATADGPLTGVPDVRPCALGGLDAPASLTLIAHTTGRTRLTNDPRAAEALVQELAGHPTALRLAAAWLAAQPRMPLSEATARLRALPGTPPAPAAPSAPPAPAPAPAPDGPGPAEEGGGAAPQQPGPVPPGPVRRPSAPPELLRAFRAAYGILPAPVARLLRSLVLAPAGSIDAQVASALAGCAVDAAERALAGLADAALLVRGPADGLYRVPGCLEELLRALLAGSDRPQDIRLARARMLERTVRLLESCRAALAREGGTDALPATVRFASPAAAAGWLLARRPALMAAARAAVADGELDTLARRLVAALVRALLALPAAAPGPAGGSRGPGTRADRYELHTLALTVAERRRLPRERAAALINLADLDAEAGRTEQAVTAYRDALQAARAADDSGAEGRVLEAIGGCHLELGDLSRAGDWFGRALALRQGRGELADQARLHARIGAVLTYQGSHGPALREWRAAAGVHRRLGDVGAQARALAEAARVQEYAGLPEDALRTCRDALYYARQVGERRLEAAVLLRLADALQHLGDTGGADLQRAAARRLLRAGERPAF